MSNRKFSMFAAAQANLIPKFLVGTSTTGLLYNSAANRYMNSADSMAQIEGFCGHQSIHRDYAGSNYTTFDVSQRRIDYDSATQTSLRTTHVSWNPDMVKLAANDAAEISKNNAWLDTIPTWHKVILNPSHEADEYQASQTYGSNYAAFRDGFRVLADLIHARNNPNWKVCLLLTAFAWKGISGTSRDPENFWPGDGYVDVMGVDMYNEGSLNASRWDSPGSSLGYPADQAEATAMQNIYAGYRYGGFLAWCESKKIKYYLIGEVGSMRNFENITPSWCASKGISNSKADWIREFANFHAGYTKNPSHGTKCYAVEYFMSPGRQYNGPDVTPATHYDNYNVNGTITNPYVESWQLFWDQNDWDAWRDVNQRYNRYIQS